MKNSKVLINTIVFFSSCQWQHYFSSLFLLSWRFLRRWGCSWLILLFFWCWLCWFFFILYRWCCFLLWTKEGLLIKRIQAGFSLKLFNSFSKSIFSFFTFDKSSRILLSLSSFSIALFMAGSTCFLLLLFRCLSSGFLWEFSTNSRNLPYSVHSNSYCSCTLVTEIPCLQVLHHIS